VATFQDSTTVEQAERNLRRQLHRVEGLTAKTHFDDLVGTSPKFKESIGQAKRFSRTNFTVTLIGESGTGKELFAQSIHNASTRRRGPFVAINCAALPDNLLESELFGYEEGAFTGARRGGKPGMFELAHGGTLLLDEVSDLSLHLQARLLRVLQEHEIMRLGGKRVTPVDIRIIAATNKNLKELVELKRFRDDLYYRLNVLNLRLCPLRERRDDLFSLFLHFVDLMDPVLGQHVRGLETSVQGQLSRYNWPGNVRELQNFAYRFVVLANPDDAWQVIREQMRRLLETGSALSNESDPQAQVPPPQIVPKRRRGGGRDLPWLLEETEGNKSEAARRMGVSRTTLWRWLKARQWNGAPVTPAARGIHAAGRDPARGRS
jgi:transcriptional regulator with PAS, ATPase and Fis domain